MKYDKPSSVALDPYGRRAHVARTLLPFERPMSKKQMEVLREFLADDYLDVSDVGVFNKSETLQLIPDLNLRDYSLDKFKVIKAGRDTAIVTYEAIQHWTLKGQEGSSHVRASSVWVERNGKWLVVFHQESTLN